MRILFLFLGLSLSNAIVAGKAPKKNSSSFVTIWAQEASDLKSAEEKKELALEQCVEQSKIYVNERLGEGAEYIDYVISKVVMKKQFDAWEKKQADGKYLFGAKVECQFSVKILKAPL